MTPQLLTGGSLSEMSRFDWYSAVLNSEGSMRGMDIVGTLADGPSTLVPGRYGYSRGYEVSLEGIKAATVFERSDRPDLVVASGPSTPVIAGALRRHNPGHTVSRADVCLDFSGGETFFRSVHGLVTDRLEGRVVLTDYVQRSPEGQAATLYVGAKTSETRVRMYEKGKESEDYEEDTIRLEVQVRPAKPARKAYAGSLEPDGFWGFARWSRWLVSEVAGKGVPAAPPRSRRVTDLEGAIEALTSQYGPRLLELADYLEGDIEAFALYLLRKSIDKHPRRL